MVSKDKYYELKNAGLCVKCSRPREDSPSQVRCKPCHEKFKSKPKEPEDNTSKTIDEIKTDSLCKVCDTPIYDYDVACRSCLTRSEFKLSDALKRYGAFCRLCNSTEVDNLCITSIDISKPMPLPNPDNYRAICHSKTLHPSYTVLCNNCYYDQNIQYVATVYRLFKQGGVMPGRTEVEKESADTIIEADYEIDD